MGKLCKRQALMDAADLGLLHYAQVDPLLHFLEERLARHRAAQARFNSTHVLFYLGGMLAIGACTLFSTLAVERWGMPVLLDLSLVYLLVTLTLATWLDLRGHAVPAAIFAALTITLVPLAMYAPQHVMGFWADGPNAAHYRDFHHSIDWRWLLIELATLVAGTIMLWRFQYTFLVMPVAVVLFYMGMDMVPALLAQSDGDLWTAAGWELRKKLTLAYGLLMLGLAFAVDLRSRSNKDYAFWLYLFGLLTFSGALSVIGDNSLNGRLAYLLAHAALVFVGAMLGRRTFAVFGGLGMAVALGQLSWGWYRDSLAFVGILTVLGFALIAAGLWWSRHEHRICLKLRSLLPEAMQTVLLARG
jgi:hypothetical protein